MFFCDQNRFQSARSWPRSPLEESTPVNPELEHRRAAQIDILLFVKADETQQERLCLGCGGRLLEEILVEVQESLGACGRVPARNVPGNLQADRRRGRTRFW